MRYSIRARLILWFILPLIILISSSLYVSRIVFAQRIDSSFDTLLRMGAERFEERLFVSEGDVRINMNYFSVNSLGTGGQGKLFYRVKDAHGRLLTGFEGLQGPVEQNNEAIFYDTVFAGTELRALRLFIPVRGSTTGSPVEVIVAESREGRENLLDAFLSNLLGINLALGISLLSIALFAIHKGLVPLKRIERALRRRSAQDLSPLQEKVPNEVQALVDSINHLMVKIKQNMQHIQQFNADVSHQLRTPIAEISVLAEMSEKQCTDPALKHYLQSICKTTEYAAHTTQQLLKYAKTKSDLVDASALMPHDLQPICREACARLLNRLLKRDQELEFIANDRPFLIRCDPIMVQWLLTNLIDNASVHAGGPHAAYTGVIRVKLEQIDNSVCLSVEDEGVGIPDDAIAHVTERFYRVNRDEKGSGLGLSIVSQVTQSHNAQLRLGRSEQGGLSVRVIFPLYLKPTPMPMV
ncbi:sensor histidine kinase [Nitrincola nitratireducens]|uniref:histidine kinase n=1 Tax=Nitrincola nitratireducens TaxID=1229521 RepID=W9UYM7_9GAMM|nr:sensor histidine kinase [Nitrincola nitratireducens]EXJ12313.1 Sensor protein qseC [Nitrincola nitratireducens]